MREELRTEAKELTLAHLRDVKGYEGLYQVTDEGDVISLDRVVFGNHGPYVRKGRTLSKGVRPGGYLMVVLCKDGIEKTHAVHRLVADAFLENPDGLPEVNHIDEDPSNNRLENLEWCTRQYNIDYSKSKAILQIDSYGCEVGRYKSIAYAARVTGISRTNINNALRGWSETAGGFRWEYVEQ